jgi:hypothetical protein
MSHPPGDPYGHRHDPPDPTGAGYPSPAGAPYDHTPPAAGYPQQPYRSRPEAHPGAGYEPQVSGPPGAGYQPQVSGPPGAGYQPQGGGGYQPPPGHQPTSPGVLGPTTTMPVVPPRRPRRILVPLLVALSAVLLVAAGVATALYVGKANQYRTTRTALSHTRTDRDQARKDLAKARDDLDAARSDLRGSRNATAESKRQLAVISKCIKLVGEAGSAAQRGDQATYNSKMKAADPVCAEADKYLK